MPAGYVKSRVEAWVYWHHISDYSKWCLSAAYNLACVHARTHHQTLRLEVCDLEMSFVIQEGCFVGLLLDHENFTLKFQCRKMNYAGRSWNFKRTTSGFRLCNKYLNIQKQKPFVFSNELNVESVKYGVTGFCFKLRSPVICWLMDTLVQWCTISNCNLLTCVGCLCFHSYQCMAVGNLRWLLVLS